MPKPAKIRKTSTAATTAKKTSAKKTPAVTKSNSTSAATPKATVVRAVGKKTSIAKLPAAATATAKTPRRKRLGNKQPPRRLPSKTSDLDLFESSETSESCEQSESSDDAIVLGSDNSDDGADAGPDAAYADDNTRRNLNDGTGDLSTRWNAPRIPLKSVSNLRQIRRRDCRRNDVPTCAICGAKFITIEEFEYHRDFKDNELCFNFEGA